MDMAHGTHLSLHAETGTYTMELPIGFQSLETDGNGGARRGGAHVAVQSERGVDTSVGRSGSECAQAMLCREMMSSS